MKKEKLNYECIVYAHNHAKAKLDFHAESHSLAEAHVQHMANAGDINGFDWDKEADVLRMFKFRFKGNVGWKEVMCYASGESKTDLLKMIRVRIKELNSLFFKTYGGPESYSKRCKLDEIHNEVWNELKEMNEVM